MCKDNFCVRSIQNSEYYEETLIESKENDGQNEDIRCDGVWDCPDGSDESSIYSGCEDINGRPIY